MMGGGILFINTNNSVEIQCYYVMLNEGPNTLNYSLDFTQFGPVRGHIPEFDVVIPGSRGQQTIQ